ncbi:MAG: IS3 family transposase [Candidatus Saccharimonadales bacterium]
MCEALEISRGTFYNHILRNKRADAWFLKRRELLKASIKEIYDESNQIFGAGKIKAVLTNQGQTVSEKIIAELMREMGLRSMRNGSKKEYRTLSREHWKSNLLLRNFDVKEPNKVWASDVTCYKHKDNFFYICAFIDLFSRKVLSLSVGRNNSTNLVRKAFDSALAGRETQGLMVHTDRGTPYTSYTMREVLRRHGIKQSFSQPGRPHDNAVIESFFASLKREELYRGS